MDSSLAQKGTRIHALLAGAPIVLNNEETRLAQSCRNIENKVVEEWAGDCEARGLIKEERVFYKKDGKNVFSGKPDVVYAKLDKSEKAHLLILDYKTGPVEADNASINMQLRGLAVAIKNFIQREYEEEIESISCAIIQPLVTWSPTVVTYSKEHIILAEEEILAICNKANADLQPSPNVYCQYCNGFVTCDACLRKLQEVAILRENVHEMLLQKTPAERRDLYENAVLATKVASAIMSGCKELLSRDIPIMGLALKEGRKRRTMTMEAFNFLASSILPRASMDRCCTVSVNSFYEEFYKMKNLYEKVPHKQCKDMFNSMFGEYIEETTTAPTIEIKR